MKKINNILKTIVIVTLSAIVSLFMSKFGIEKDSIIMAFLVGVLIITMVTNGYFYGAVASVASILLFNYLLTDPVHTLYIYNPNDIVLLVTFFVASIITSSLTSRFQKQLEIAKNNERTACLLCEITNSFLNITGEKNIVMQGISYIYNHTGYSCKIIIKDSNEVYSDEDTFDAGEDKKILKIEIPGLKKKLGEIQVIFDGEKLTLENELLIKTVASQLGSSLDREFIYNERENIRIDMEREKLKSNLLRGISHDLRTPLTAIVGASGVIIDNIEQLDLNSINKLVKDINEESIWLNNLVENILNMTKIGDGKLILEKQDEVVDDIINEALRHVAGLINNRNIEVSMPKEVVVVPMDGKLIVQVLINLLDNAIKHTKEDCNIYLRVFTEGENAVFEVADDGDGINKEVRDNLFESFITVSGKFIDSKRGMGLGLAICKAIVDAHKGEILAGDAKEGGALFRFTLPLMKGE